MRSQPWTVMTRNVYVGADITAPLEAAADLAGPAAADAFGRASDQVFRTAHATDFRIRGRLLAAEIADAAPDLVGLQEVALWRRGPLDLTRLGRPAADEVAWNFLEILLGELTAAGTPYEVGHLLVGADVEAPAFTGSVLDGTASGRNVRLTVRDVVLVRSDAGIVVTDAAATSFEDRLVATVAGAAFTFAHGYVRIDATRGPDRLRFVSTHLDSQSPSIATAQAGELVAALESDDRPLIVVGDFNSDPDDAASSGPYDLVVEHGFRDAAAAVGETDPTWGFGDALAESDPTGFSQRIDFVFLGDGLSPVSAARTGVSTSDRDPISGLWPSDHAGVVVTAQ